MPGQGAIRIPLWRKSLHSRGTLLIADSGGFLVLTARFVVPSESAFYVGVPNARLTSPNNPPHAEAAAASISRAYRAYEGIVHELFREPFVSPSLWVVVGREA